MRAMTKEQGFDLTSLDHATQGRKNVIPKSKKTLKVRDQVPAQDPKGGRHGMPPKYPNSGGGKSTQRQHFAPR